MKLKFIALLILIGVVGCSQDLVSLDELRLLGTKEFSTEGWMNGSQKERGEMVYSLIKGNDITKLKASDIKVLLGDFTAYYEYDEFPAYIVGSTNIESEYEKGYLLAFPIDRESRLVTQYIIIPRPKK